MFLIPSKIWINFIFISELKHLIESLIKLYLFIILNNIFEYFNDLNNEKKFDFLYIFDLNFALYF